MSAATSPPLLVTEALEVGFGGRALLPPIDLELRRGTLLLVLGRNGSGKTTLVRTLLGLAAPIAGRVRWAPGVRRAYVPQAGAIDPAIPVRACDVTRWGTLRGWDFLRPWRRTPHAVIDGALDEMGVGAVAHRPLRALSGGQVQRVLFARILAGGADVIVLDEPTAAVDAAGERTVYGNLARLARERGLAVVVVTHAVSATLGVCDEVLLLDRPDDDARAAGTVLRGLPGEVAASAPFRQLFGVVAEAPHG